MKATERLLQKKSVASYNQINPEIHLLHPNQ